MKANKFKFIDLFAGIGGFHQAMRYLGGECLMAAEINQACVETYNLNYKTLEGKVRGNVNDIDPLTIDSFDVLCAGFPCQPFSKAGYQKGFKDESRGNLFFKIIDILDGHPEVKFVILENVRNLADKSENWDVIKSELSKRNFYITEKPIILSPSDFGLPQIRERVYILGIKKSIKNNEILNNGCIHVNDLNLKKYYKVCQMGDAWKILEQDVSDDYLITAEQEEMIFAWDEFRQATNIGVIGFPIWLNSFGVNFEDEDLFRQEQGYEDMPNWKKRFVDNNRKLYLENRDFIDDWIVRYDMFNRIKLLQKFEWNCGIDVDDIHNTIIQIRQSGIRIKRPTYYPSLVAMVNTPIIWDRQKQHFRHITQREAANLQNFHGKFKFPRNDKAAYKQLGNSVNVRVLKILGEQLFALANEGWGDEENE
ncbi:DNA (cytosine-5)-methyltransferase 1 [Lacrimispora sphenoides]|uniref:DNA (cytosine-5-)-methyltransferase n=1 Tax=Lacrimispora sphenoides TaxID=29370 RepID=UPI0008BFA638|nr:DNA (cytosine-5-)-methyltransferase [Lacrimispora sphenoides]SET70518.1 DNA (cytosine-5)-methyltransferase 1 [Lacrimispora sphenoides]